MPLCLWHHGCLFNSLVFVVEILQFKFYYAIICVRIFVCFSTARALINKRYFACKIRNPAVWNVTRFESQLRSPSLLSLCPIKKREKRKRPEIRQHYTTWPEIITATKNLDRRVKSKESALHFLLCGAKKCARKDITTKMRRVYGWLLPLTRSSKRGLFCRWRRRDRSLRCPQVWSREK